MVVASRSTTLELCGFASYEVMRCRSEKSLLTSGKPLYKVPDLGFELRYAVGIDDGTLGATRFSRRFLG